ncbi:MAG: hypothetical protein QOH13_2642 [Thermoleophilaceae bacterium]|jgi:hypothetical protein|nr:hypothetical protein [Thermoleophilaceae bacterium]
MRINKKFLAGTISALLLLCAPSAFAASSAQQGYSKPGGIVQTQLDNGGGRSPGASASTPEAATSHGSLPFTGLDIVLVVAAGGLLLGLGLGMRRLSRTTGAA